jgi:anthranilate phosphoribosyltransferase
LKDGKISSYEITPEECGLARAQSGDLKGGTARENAELLRGILSGNKGAQRDVVLLNTAAALIAGGKTATFREGIAMAAAAIDSGKASQKLEEFIAFSQNPL